MIAWGALSSTAQDASVGTAESSRSSGSGIVDVTSYRRSPIPTYNGPRAP